MSSPTSDRDPGMVFEILVREHADMLTAYLRSVVRDPVAVDDLFQETMMTAWRRLDDFDRTRPFGPWVRGIAANLILAHGRKKKRDGLICNEAVLMRIDQQMERLAARRGDTFDEKVEALHDCIDRLPEAHGEVIRMRYLDALTSAQVATRLDLSREALKKRLQRARAQLLECLQRKSVLGSSST